MGLRLANTRTPGLSISQRKHASPWHVHIDKPSILVSWHGATTPTDLFTLSNIRKPRQATWCYLGALGIRSFNLQIPTTSFSLPYLYYSRPLRTKWPSQHTTFRSRRSLSVTPLTLSYTPGSRIRPRGSSRHTALALRKEKKKSCIGSHIPKVP
jgi:hypothetical protein